MSKNNIYPCFWFNGNAAEAADFYCATFPGTRILEKDDLVVLLDMRGERLMMLNGGPEFKVNASVTMMVICLNEQEVQEYWNKLTLNGEVMMPLDSYPWSKKYGWVTDKYGIGWQLYLGEQLPAMQKFVPSIAFTGDVNGKAREAIELYTTVFPDSEVEGILPYGEGEEDTAGHVQHAQFNLDDYTVMCMDSSNMPGVSFSEGVSMVVVTDDQAETDEYWNALTANGGAESMCGWLKDKFGLSWQIIPRRLLELRSDPDAAKAKRVHAAMLTMKKIDIDKLEEAAK